MKKSFAIPALILAAALCSGCGRSQESAEIKIPILDGNAGGSFTTAAAERRDTVRYKTMGAGVEYVFAETLPVPYDSNVIEYNARMGGTFSEGDVIAVFDSSAFDYDYRNQKILADSAYSRWQASGSEISRLEYEQAKKELDLIQYRIDQCTVKAPYDCVVCDAKIRKAGETVSAGDPICKIAKPDEVYITVKDNKELFAFGMPVSVKFGTSSTFSGKVAMVPEGGRGGISSVIIKLDEGELERANEEAGNIASAGWGTVIVVESRESGALCVPEKAVMTYSGETYCYIEDNGERVRVPVEAGETYDDVTVILSGLAEGDIVSY